MKLTVSIQQCIDAFRKVRASIVEAMVLLHRVHEDKSWQGSYSTWTEFVEDGLQISSSQASKLLSVYDAYVIERGVDLKQMHGIDTEKLYLAIPLLDERSPAQVLQTAQALTRAEIRSTLSMNGLEECKRHEWIEICTVCHKRRT